MRRLQAARLAVAGLLVAATPLVMAGLLVVARLPVASLAAAGGGLTPGVAAGGIPLAADVYKVLAMLGTPSVQFQDPTNPRIYIQRWEARCLGARYTPDGALLALDVWADLGESCPDVGATYGVAGAAGAVITFRSTRPDVKRAFGYVPDRVLRTGRFSLFVYDDAGVAFYVRETGERRDLVDAMTMFPRHASRTIWTPQAWATGR